MSQIGVVERMELKHVWRVDGNLHPISGPVEQNSTESVGCCEGLLCVIRREGADQMLVLILYWWQFLPYPVC